MVAGLGSPLHEVGNPRGGRPEMAIVGAVRRSRQPERQDARVLAEVAARPRRPVQANRHGQVKLRVPHNQRKPRLVRQQRHNVTTHPGVAVRFLVENRMYQPFV